MLYGDSRSGKTFLIVAVLILRAIKAPGSRHAIFRIRFNDNKTSIGLDTLPKVMVLRFPGVSYKIDRTDWVCRVGGSAAKRAAIGVKDNERNISNKIARGSFTAVFFVQCLEAIGCHTIHLEDSQ
jgi:hypothetical protein